MTHYRQTHTLRHCLPLRAQEDWTEGVSWPGENSDLSETGVALTKITLASMIVTFPVALQSFSGLPCASAVKWGQGSTTWLNSASRLGPRSAACLWVFPP